ncbi:hypothetical protein DM860_000991 [Cuscuta australis]|uniref:RING-type E3 ubiquitin transferase n=1 Tax=Cuscuta australis TaxID=267555 RepID=A0A328DWW4_9ASTE|nr:hypothetical protein DM860_000991 [Cuscuta australis]
MAASFGYVQNGSIRSLYEAKCYIVLNKNLNSSLRAAAPIATASPIAAAAAAAPGTSSSAPVVFRVQCVLRLSVAGNPVNEFLEEKDWRETRQSSLELPWSRDGLIIDDTSLELKLSETLTALRVSIHSSANFVDSVKKLIVGARDVNEKDDDALIQDWFLKLTNAINRVAWRVTEEEDAKEEEEEKEAKKEEEEKVGKEEEEEKEAKEEEGIEEEEEKRAKEEEEEKEAKEEGEKKEANEEEEWTCPICLGIIESHEAWSEMPCCSRAFHCDCISPWIKRLHKFPWCRSSLPLVLQSARGLIERHNSEYILYPSPSWAL